MTLSHFLTCWKGVTALLLFGWRGITIMVSSSFDLFMCERYLLGYYYHWCTLLIYKSLTMVVLFFLNLLMDNHCCILGCTLLISSECLIRLAEHYPPQGFNEGFFWTEKKLLLRRLRRVNEGLSPLYLRFLGIWNKECTSTTTFLFKSTPFEIFGILLIILPPEIFCFI